MRTGHLCASAQVATELVPLMVTWRFISERLLRGSAGDEVDEEEGAILQQIWGMERETSLARRRAIGVEGGRLRRGAPPAAPRVEAGVVLRMGVGGVRWTLCPYGSACRLGDPAMCGAVMCSPDCEVAMEPARYGTRGMCLTMARRRRGSGTAITGWR